eukprot:SAG22_NODE_11194_length_496_cov_0.992443_2_plen_122_part_01
MSAPCMDRQLPPCWSRGRGSYLGLVAAVPSPPGVQWGLHRGRAARGCTAATPLERAQRGLAFSRCTSQQRWLLAGGWLVVLADDVIEMVGRELLALRCAPPPLRWTAAAACYDISDHRVIPE